MSLKGNRADDEMMAPAIIVYPYSSVLIMKAPRQDRDSIYHQEDWPEGLP